MKTVTNHIVNIKSFWILMLKHIKKILSNKGMEHGTQWAQRNLPKKS